MRRRNVSTPRTRPFPTIPIFGWCIARRRRAFAPLRGICCKCNMKQLPIIMPQLGESIAEATIVNYLVKPGEVVAAYQDVIEVETNKATMNVAAPCGGKVVNITAKLTESYPVGAVLGYVELSPQEAQRLGLDQEELDPTPSQARVIENPGIENGPAAVQPMVRGLPVPANAGGASYMSPRMKARMNELGLHAADLAGVPGSGAAGRVTIKDFEKFLANLEKHKLST